ncbi:MAG TPA: thiamine-phosphate kinase [Saprospiraceae bacterium]|nr:thiamine-phosphate kinase [Saprospiraceae bacterium]HRO09713.1 thiamine-phosphate kinase [Saprospiraceae bacterium]HRO72433.1 thiamine-phosphate kinase [Saprospiraceae bacterium]HRP42969.1 thiamine-phosphate kinase [Saprospiraceae bacterium]
MSNNDKPSFTDISTIGEFGLISQLTDNKVSVQPSTIKSIGDDAAIIRNEQECTVVCTDMLVEGIHFDLMYTPLKHLGYKAVVVNLSDIYAMNAEPKQITVSVAISSKYSVEAMQELYDGIYTACKFYNVDLVGGDTTSSPRGMVISVTAVGQANQQDIVYRNGAKKGDIICVTGDLGAAYLGLQILEREKQIFLEHPGVQPELEPSQYLIERQLKPEAQRGAIAYFRKEQIIPTSMIDISDGLASEIMHICSKSGVGAFIEESKVPIHPDSEKTAIDFKLDPITCALHGGEDFELLFTIDEKDLNKIRYMPEVFIIGEIVDAADGIKLHTSGGNIHEITAQGWNHFRQ